MRREIESYDVQGRPLRISVGWAFASRRGIDADSRLYADTRKRKGLPDSVTVPQVA